MTLEQLREPCELPFATYEWRHRYRQTSCARGTARCSCSTDAERCWLGDFRRRRHPIQRRVVLENRALQFAQVRSRVEAELLSQGPARLFERAQCLGLPPGPIQRQHELLAKALAQR